MRLLARFNPWKMAAMSLAGIGLSIVPNLPNFGDGLVYNAIFFQTSGGIGIRIACSAVVFLGGIYVFARSVEAFVHRDAIWIDRDRLYWRALGVKSLDLADINSVSKGPNKAIRVELKNGRRSKDFVTWVYSKDDVPEPLLSDLRAAIVYR